MHLQGKGEDGVEGHWQQRKKAIYMYESAGRWKLYKCVSKLHHKEMIET